MATEEAGIPNTTTTTASATSEPSPHRALLDALGLAFRLIVAIAVMCWLAAMLYRIALLTFPERIKWRRGQKEDNLAHQFVSVPADIATHSWSYVFVPVIRAFGATAVAIDEYAGRHWAIIFSISIVVALLGLIYLMLVRAFRLPLGWRGVVRNKRD